MKVPWKVNSANGNDHGHSQGSTMWKSIWVFSAPVLAVVALIVRFQFGRIRRDESPNQLETSANPQATHTNPQHSSPCGEHEDIPKGIVCTASEMQCSEEHHGHSTDQQEGGSTEMATDSNRQDNECSAVRIIHHKFWGSTVAVPHNVHLKHENIVEITSSGTYGEGYGTQIPTSPKIKCVTEENMYEATISPTISHCRNLGQIFSMEPIERPVRHSWFEIEYCNIGTLQKAITDGRFYMDTSCQKHDWDFIVEILKDIARAVEFLHSHRIVHCDLRPQNILLSGCNKDKKKITAKVADFGFGYQLPPEEDACAVTHHGAVTASAPEVLGDGKVYLKSDVYSFGILIWQIISGVQPYAYCNPETAERAVLQGRRPDIPFVSHPVLARLIQICWNPKISSRPSMANVLQKLNSIPKWVELSRSRCTTDLFARRYVSTREKYSSVSSVGSSGGDHRPVLPPSKSQEKEFTFQNNLSAGEVVALPPSWKASKSIRFTKHRTSEWNHVRYPDRYHSVVHPIPRRIFREPAPAWRSEQCQNSTPLERASLRPHPRHPCTSEKESEEHCT